MDGWGGGGGGGRLKRGGAGCRRSRLGEGAGGGTPPAQLGGTLFMSSGTISDHFSRPKIFIQGWFYRFGDPRGARL